VLNVLKVHFCIYICIYICYVSTLSICGQLVHALATRLFLWLDTRAASLLCTRAAGRSWGCVSALDSEGRTIWIVDAHRDHGRRFVVHADEKLTSFLEVESAIRAI